MAVTYDSLKALSRQTMKRLLNVAGWQKFLSFASQSFKLPFPAQVLAYAQRPEAAALMTAGDWRTAYGREIREDAQGIAVPDGQTVKYYYDISDTLETDKPKPVPLWQVQPEHREQVTAALTSYLGSLGEPKGFAKTLLAAARKTVACTLDDRLGDLTAHSPGSLLEELDEDNIRAAYSAIMENSVAYMLLSRCGVDPAPYLVDEDFHGLPDFNTPSTLTILGTAVVETAAMCLSVIAKAVRRARAVPKPVLLQAGPEERYMLQGKWELTIVGGDADSVRYTFLDLPEQGPVSVPRKDFDTWLAAGFIQPVPAAIPA